MNMDKEQQKRELESFGTYFFPHFGEYGRNVIKEIEKDLEEIKNITDLTEKSKKCAWAVSKHSQNEALIATHWNNGRLAELGINYEETLGKYEKLIRELRSIEAEIDKKINTTTCKYCQKKNLVNPYVQLKGSEYEEVFCDVNCNSSYYAPCDKCQKNRYGVDYNHPDKNDNNSKHKERERERERETKSDFAALNLPPV